MRITVVCVSRNKSIYVTTLHMLLQLSVRCFQNGHQINVQFVQDASGMSKIMKSSDRLLWVDYGACLDSDSFDTLFDKYEVLVYPSVKEGINWEVFKDRVKKGTDEPIGQVGLDFDTDVGKKISDGMYVVNSSNPAVFAIDCAKVIDKVRDKKGQGMNLPTTIEDVFKKFVQKEVKITAYSKCKVLRHYSHECVGNILEAIGVSCKE